MAVRGGWRSGFTASASQNKRARPHCSPAHFLVYPLAVVIPMWAAHTLVGNIENPEHAYVLVAEKILPSISPGLLGLFIASMFAATMSMIDSDLNALAAVFTKDIYQRTFNKNANDQLLLRVGMLATVVLGSLTIGAALLTIKMHGAFNTMIQWFAAILGPISLPLLLGMILKKPTWRGAILSWLFGMLTFVFFRFAWTPLTGFATSFPLYTGMELLVSFLVFIGEGQITKRPAGEEKRVQEFFEQFE